MRTYLVTRDVVIDDETIAPVHFTVNALSGVAYHITAVKV